MISEPILSGASVSKSNAWETDDRYAQRHTLQIAACLRTLVARGDFLTVEFGDKQFVTQLLDVDARRAHILFDFGSTARDNRELVDADELTFRSQPSGIHTHFVTGGAVVVMFRERPAFEVPFPALLHYVQRRDFYRIDTPMTDPFVASGVDGAGAAFRFELHDLSLGGMALRARDARFESLAAGTVWNNVKLQVGRLGAMPVDFEVVAPRQMITPTGEHRTVLGCRFINLKANAERVLQRAITLLETRRKERSARD